MSVRVAIAIIINDKNQILISKRSAEQHQGNKWEFPGGKLEPNETSQDALQRELKEELGIQVKSTIFFMALHHQYKDKKICLDVYKVTSWGGNVQGLEGQPIQWIERSELINYQFPAANADIIRRLS